jgi:hypothetical protein
MKIHKAFITMVTFMLVAVGILPSAQAALSGIANGWNYTTSMDPVGIHLYDLNSSHDAILNANTISFPKPSIRLAPTLEYSINDGDWEDFSGPLSIHYDQCDPVQISLRFHPRGNYNSHQLFSADDVTLQTYDKTKSNEAGLDLFQALYVVWDINNYSAVTFFSANDPVSPNAPIPASALLLFTGLIGIIGFRRRMNNE